VLAEAAARLPDGRRQSSSMRSLRKKDESSDPALAKRAAAARHDQCGRAVSVSASPPVWRTERMPVAPRRLDRPAMAIRVSAEALNRMSWIAA
jgi:hypothetical protein